MTLLPEQLRAREYFEQKGTRLTAAAIRERVATALTAFEDALASVDEAEARRRAWPGEWCVQEVVDHLIVSHRPSIGELRDLLEGRRPATGPVAAGLQSTAPMQARWPDLVGELRALHREALDVLAGAPEGPVGPARAPIVMVVNARQADGTQAPVHWIEDLDWKAYAATAFRLHALDHRSQVTKTLAALRGGA
jgi:DinB family protein